jgi:hypothetical protein
MVGVPGADVNNTLPPRIPLFALGLLQTGVLLSLEGPARRMLERGPAWTATVLINSMIMTIYLWHLTAMIAVLGVSLLFDGVGLRLEAGSGTWWATRPLWLALMVVVVSPFIAGFNRFERPKGDIAPPPVWRGIAGVVLVCAGLGSLAFFGVGDEQGVNWEYLALPFAGAFVGGVVGGGRQNGRTRTQNAERPNPPPPEQQDRSTGPRVHGQQGPDDRGHSYRPVSATCRPRPCVPRPSLPARTPTTQVSNSREDACEPCPTSPISAPASTGFPRRTTGLQTTVGWGGARATAGAAGADHRTDRTRSGGGRATDRASAGGNAGEDQLPGPAHHRTPPRPVVHHRRAPGGDRGRRDRFGQEHPAPQAVPRGGAGDGGTHRPHPAPAYRRPLDRRAGGRGAGQPGGRTGRLHGAVHRSGGRRHPHQGDDRRDPAGRDPPGPATGSLRHDHHRRGPRAQPQHRLPTRLSQAAGSRAARPEGDHHLGHHRHRTLRRALRRRAGGGGVRAHLPGRGALPPPRRPRAIRAPRSTPGHRRRSGGAGPGRDR